MSCILFTRGGTPNLLTGRQKGPARVRLACSVALSVLFAGCGGSNGPGGGAGTLPGDGSVVVGAADSAAADGSAAGGKGDIDARPQDAGADAASGEAGGPLPVSPELLAQHCDPSRPGFAYRASSGPRSVPLAAPADQAAPIPCYHAFDYGGAEPSIVVTRDGSVLYAPVFTPDGVGVITTRDRGASWDVTVPTLANGGKHGRVQPYMAHDSESDRVIFATNATVGVNSPQILGFNLTITDDAGKSWKPGHLPIDAADWVKIFSGKPRTVATRGFPSVIYASAPNPISTPVPYASLIGVKPDHQSVFRSTDGGETWEAVGRISLLPAQTPGCDPSEWLIMGSAVVAPDGTAHQVFRRCRELAVVSSQDDGATWTVRNVPGATLPPFDTGSLTGIIANPNVLISEALTVDDAGNLYLVYVDADGSLRLQASQDAGSTYSAPVTVQSPDVNAVVYGAVASAKPGTIAIAYYGSSDHGVSYHGYIAESENALDATPTFQSVRVNPPDDPLYRWGFEVGYLGILELADLNEIVQVKYAPDGDVWASFVKDKCDGAAHYGTCTWDVAAHANSGFQSVVGRLVHGKAPQFAPAPSAAAPSGPSVCQYDDLPDATQCVSLIDKVSDDGVCAELSGCICNHCRCETYNCQEDKKCTDLLVCAAKNNCRGQECLVLCPGEVKLAGDLLVTRALAVANCANSASCPMIQFCPLDFLFAQ
jgi:hypothetical protein